MTDALERAAACIVSGGTLEQAAVATHAYSSAWAAAAEARLGAEGRPAACPGCRLGHCCEQPVMATFVEALAVALSLERSGRVDRALRRTLRRAGEKQERTLLDGRESDRRLRCPFIDKTNRCTVYAARPTTCRTYVVFDGREACTPYAQRADGLRPMVAVVNNGEPVGRSIQVAMDVAESLGWDRAIYCRVLPLQVATWLDAAAGPPIDFWAVVRERSAASPDSIMQIARNQASAVEGFDPAGAEALVRELLAGGVPWGPT